MFIHCYIIYHKSVRFVGKLIKILISANFEFIIYSTKCIIATYISRFVYVKLRVGHILMTFHFLFAFSTINASTNKQMTIQISTLEHKYFLWRLNSKPLLWCISLHYIIVPHTRIPLETPYFWKLQYTLK